MSPNRRGCYFWYEKELNFFPIYSEENCIVECGWQSAAVECGCVPWYLNEHFPDALLCDQLLGQPCFDKIMTARSDLDTKCIQQCLPNCITMDISIGDELFGQADRSKSCKEAHDGLRCDYLESKTNNTLVQLQRVSDIEIRQVQRHQKVSLPLFLFMSFQSRDEKKKSKLDPDLY